MKRLLVKLVAFLPLADTTVIIDSGHAIRRRGQVRTVLLSELTELAKSEGIADACLHVSTTTDEFKLSIFGIPTSLHQRCRNVWGANWK